MFDLMPFNNRNEKSDTPSERIFDSFVSNFFNSELGELTNSSFKTDIKENEDAYIVEAEMPGLDKDNINLEIHDNHLIISAHNKKTVENEGENYIHKERRIGNYQRRFRLGNVKEEDIKAEYDNGILEITLPKEESDDVQKKTIDIH